MKIAICSDLHLEFRTIVLENTEGADVLVLSGDIIVERDLDMYDRRQVEMGFSNKRSDAFHEFFQTCAENFPYVIYVAGNHEHYHGDYRFTCNELKRKLAYIKNLYVLDREVKVIDDVTFIGGTLWTDMNKEDPITLFHMKSMMNDFVCVTNSNNQVNYKVYMPVDKPVGMTDEEWLQQPVETRNKPVFKLRDAKFTPEDAVADHRKMVEYIQVVTAMLGKNDNKYVVVGHHAPSRQSTHPRYKHDQVMNGGYSSDLDLFIEDRPCIKLWTHGHTHEPFDYMIGETRIVCNPRGYKGHEQRAEDFELKFVDV